MRKVFKPNHIVNDYTSKVQIPDVSFKKETDEEKPPVLTDEILDKVRKEIREEVNKELGRKKAAAEHERDSIIAKAKKDAKKLLDDASVSRKSIIDEANAAAAKMKVEAYEEGLKKGITEKSEALDKLSGLISENIEIMKNDESQYFTEYENQLRYIASEIAEKIIYQKIADDDMTMYNLVKNAIKSVRDASWITAEVSEKLSGYIDSLEKELADSGIKADITIKEGSPDDTCVINTSDGLVVATVSQQLANLKEFIEMQGKTESTEMPSKSESAEMPSKSDSTEMPSKSESIETQGKGENDEQSS